MLVKNNNMLLNIFISVLLLVYHVSKQHSLTQGVEQIKFFRLTSVALCHTSTVLAIPTLPLLIHNFSITYKVVLNFFFSFLILVL